MLSACFDNQPGIVLQKVPEFLRNRAQEKARIDVILKLELELRNIENLVALNQRIRNNLGIRRI